MDILNRCDFMHSLFLFLFTWHGRVMTLKTLDTMSKSYGFEYNASENVHFSL